MVSDHDHDADMEDDDFDYAAAFDFMDGDAVKAMMNTPAEQAELMVAPTPIKAVATTGKEPKKTPANFPKSTAEGTPTATDRTFDMTDPMRRRLSMTSTASEDSLPSPDLGAGGAGLSSPTGQPNPNPVPPIVEHEPDAALALSPPAAEPATDATATVPPMASSLDPAASPAGPRHVASPVTPLATPTGGPMPPCSACGKVVAETVVTPHDGKRKVFLCVPCAKKTLFCEGCKAPRERIEVSDEERCGVCQWLGCPDEDCFGACPKCKHALRPMRYQQCRLKKCQQRWAESTRWCASCGSCALKSCTPKFHACKLDTCRRLKPVNPCSKTAAGGAALSAKHYHCTKCQAHATKIEKCASCERACACSKCNTCGTGGCCHTGTTKCNIKSCENDICRKCVSKVTATGKQSKLCAKHSGARAAIMNKQNAAKRNELTKQEMLAKIKKAKAAAAKANRKRKRCSGCDGTEREDRTRFRIVNGVAFCGPCEKRAKVAGAGASDSAGPGSHMAIQVSDAVPPTPEMSAAMKLLIANGSLKAPAVQGVAELEAAAVAAPAATN